MTEIADRKGGARHVVAACREPADLAFTPEEVMDRVQRHGDLFAPVVEPAGRGRPP